MTKKNRTRFRIISLVAVLAIATGTVLWVSAQSTDETRESRGRRTEPRPKPSSRRP